MWSIPQRISTGGGMTTSRVRGVIGIVSAVIGAAALLSAQHPGSPSFEVASVKPHRSVDQTSSSVVQPGGRYTATNATVRMLMRTAYGAHDDQIVGGPNWTSSERFDIVGKAEGNPPTTTFRDPYSVRSASRGLRRAARRAGSQHARSATHSSITVVAAKTAGSRGLTW
jgi:hypothetical protein